MTHVLDTEIDRIKKRYESEYNTWLHCMEKIKIYTEMKKESQRKRPLIANKLMTLIGNEKTFHFIEEIRIKYSNKKNK